MRSIKPFGLRLPPELKMGLEQAARQNGRSLNAEIVARLSSPAVVVADVATIRKLLEERDV